MTTKALVTRVNRRELSVPIIKKLFALSGKRCPMPNCGTQLVYNEINKVKGIICHIEAASEGGPRYNSSQGEEERHDYPNLIVLCPNCHTDIDNNPQKYSVNYLQTVKKQHETKFMNNPYGVPDNILQVLRISVNQDEFSLNKITSFFRIYFELGSPNVKKSFYADRLKYSLSNISLQTLEGDFATKSQLDEIFKLIGKLPENELAECFLTLQAKLPPLIFEEYVEQYKGQIAKSLEKSKDKMFSGIYWMIHNRNLDSLLRLIDSVENYGVETFKDLIQDFDYEQFNDDTKLKIEQDLWKRLDKEKDSNSVVYKNLLELDSKVFNSLQARPVLH
jgi:hypothetical protein